MATIRTDDKGVTWINVNYSELKGVSKAAFEASVKARKQFIDTLEAEARKSGNLGKDEHLRLNFKSYGFGMTKANGKSSTQDIGNMFAGLSD